MHFEESVLYRAGENGYHTHRIPALLTTLRGTVLAFSEARKFTGRDSDQIDLVVRRSSDGGATFGPMQVVACENGWVSGNPAPVQDRETGTISLLFCMNPVHERGETEIISGNLPRTVWITRSSDDGTSWSTPAEITQQVKKQSWTWYATGPCHGFQLESGRLIVPCDHVDGNVPEYARSGHSHLVCSDDHGETWHIGGIAQAGTNESVAVQTLDGSLYLNCRNFAYHSATGERQNRRACAWSHDDGSSFTHFGIDDVLVDPICQAGMVRMTSTKTGSDRNRVLFSNPAGVSGGQYIRSELTVRLSYDECITWPVSRVVCAGRAAYSDLCIAPDGSVCCFYEKGPEPGSDGRDMVLARFDLGWLTNGADR